MERVLPIKKNATTAFQIDRAYAPFNQVEAIAKREAESMINLLHSSAHSVCGVAHFYYFLRTCFRINTSGIGLPASSTNHAI